MADSNENLHRTRESTKPPMEKISRKRRGSAFMTEQDALKDTLDKGRTRRRSTVILTEHDLGGIEHREAEEEKIREEQKHITLTLRDYNLIFAMPFFCTFANCVTFVYFIIYLVEEFRLDYVTIGFLIGAFHFCRVITITASIFFTKTAHLLGCMIGLAGFITLLCGDKSKISVFAVGNIITGFAEASSAVFVYSKNMYATDVPKMRMAMSYQSAMLGVAVIIGFYFGGIGFKKFGVDGIAVAGIIALGLEIASLLYYLLTCNEADSKNQIRSDKGQEATFPEEEITEKETGFKVSDIRQSLQNEKLSDEFFGMYSNTEGIVANSFTLLISAIFSMESIACGYLFSIGPIFIKKAFDADESLIGTIFSCASLLGSVVTILAISPKGRAFQKKHLRSPYSLYVLVVIITCSAFGCLIPSFSVHVISILFLIGACETFLALVSELQGAITTSHYYTVLGPSAQMLRRIVNVIMAVTGPIVFGVFPRLPYLITGSLCLVFSVVFVFGTEAQSRRNAKLVIEMMNSAGKDDAKQFRRMSLASRECLARISETILTEAENKNIILTPMCEEGIVGFPEEEEIDIFRLLY
eukprot:CAMPEP_0194338556 /NCGR_PEP_ID=MMETSP0171-20130528/80038_1 /TAXON_ID=218684 /ORGANISM="Corethron pennatum, Strain L29A3" /LENGTH=583 /DNA_ID=CAMNT_0039102739 /DNA_START=163 /DNA_END=1914 /DNA_ORIENTATION=-